jgi:hypothetical protein
LSDLSLFLSEFSSIFAENFRDVNFSEITQLGLTKIDLSDFQEIAMLFGSTSENPRLLREPPKLFQLRYEFRIT